VSKYRLIKKWLDAFVGMQEGWKRDFPCRVLGGGEVDIVACRNGEQTTEWAATSESFEGAVQDLDKLVRGAVGSRGALVLRMPPEVVIKPAGGFVVYCVGAVRTRAQARTMGRKYE